MRCLTQEGINSRNKRTTDYIAVSAAIGMACGNAKIEIDKGVEK